MILTNEEVHRIVNELAKMPYWQVANLIAFFTQKAQDEAKPEVEVK
jgi:hypothetical protein